MKTGKAIKAIDKQLHYFCDDLVPSDDFINSSSKIANKIFLTLQEHSRFRLARCYISGSVGKKSAILTTDIDLVIFVNSVQPPFEKVLQDFASIVETELYDIKDLRTSKFAVRFKYQGYSIDLLAATNKVMSPSSTGKLAAQQALQIYKLIDKGICPAYWYSSSLCESQLNFMRQQSSFTHDLVRLAKFWNKSIFMDGYISGRSTLIELIAVAAAQQEERQGPTDHYSLFRAFKIFLNFMQDFENLQIKFPDYHPFELNWKPSNWLVSLVVSFLKDADLMTKPYVIEPANPYNNIAKSIGRGQVKAFKSAATVTLARLQEVKVSYFKWNNFSYEPSEDFFVLHHIFQPPDELVPMSSDARDYLNESTFEVQVIHCVKSGSGPPCVSTKYANPEDQPFKRVIKNLENFFTVVGQAFVSDYWIGNYENGSMEDCRDLLEAKIKECIDVNVLDIEHDDRWEPDEDDFYPDVTWKIPLWVGDEKLYICVKMQRPDDSEEESNEDYDQDETEAEYSYDGDCDGSDYDYDS